MFVNLRTFIMLLAAGVAGPAFGGDAYYDVPIRELKLTEGEMPVRKEASEYRPYTEMERLRAMRPYAVLDGPGEAYIVGRGEPHDTWYSPYYDGSFPDYAVPVEAPVGSVPPTATNPPNFGGATRVFIRAPEGREATGRLYVPNADLTGMVALKFSVPAAAAKAEGKVPFLWAKRAHFDMLRNRNIPGGAWFRHQAKHAQAELNLRPDERPTRPTASVNFNRGDDLTRTYELFTGGRAMSENLQLDRALPERDPDETPVKIDTLAGITIDEIDWKPLIGDAKPKLDPLAKHIPFDQHAVFFPSFKAAVAIADETGRHDTPVLRLAQPRSEDARVIAHYNWQLGLPWDEITRLFGPKVLKSIALTGSDPYYPTGTDVAVLFESPHPTELEKLLYGVVYLAFSHEKDAELVEGEINKLKYRGFVTPDRRISSYVARLDGAVAVSNSLYQLGRLAAVAKGEAKPVADLPEYTFFRIRYPLGAADETALAFLSDATIRRWCGPRWRIAASRRTRARAIMAELQAAHLDPLVKKTVNPGPIHTEFPMFGGELSLAESGVASSVYGTLDFMTPIGEIPLEEVSKAEAEAYEAWRDGYQRNWSWAFDPIALKIGLGEKALTADLSVMPLILRTEYAGFMSISMGGKFEPTDGDRHDALAQFMLAIDHDSDMFRQGNNFASMMGQAVSLGWIGRWVNVYADDDPFWRDLAQVKPDEMGKFMEENVGRLPVAVRIDASNPLKLAAFLTGARAFIEQTAPGLTQWESLKYGEQPYVRIMPVKGNRSVPRELEKIKVFYATIDGALTITLNEDVLRRSIDRSLARQKAAAEGNGLEQASRPWLGSNVALRVDNKVLEIANAANRRQYEEAMQLRCWNNLPILNEWKRLYPDRDPVEVHRQAWGVFLLCPGGGKYVWNDRYQTMESTVYGHPGEPKQGPAAPPMLSDFSAGNFGLTLEHKGLRARVLLERAAPAQLHADRD